MATEKLNTPSALTRSIQDRVKAIVASAPPMTNEQAARIASMLRPYGSDAA